MISPIDIEDPAELAAREYALELAAGHARDADADKAAVIVAAFARQLTADLGLRAHSVAIEACVRIMAGKVRNDR